MRWLVWPVLVGCVLVAGCGEEPADDEATECTADAADGWEWVEVLDDEYWHKDAPPSSIHRVMLGNLDVPEHDGRIVYSHVVDWEMQVALEGDDGEVYSVEVDGESTDTLELPSQGDYEDPARSIVVDAYGEEGEELGFSVQHYKPTCDG